MTSGRRWWRALALDDPPRAAIRVAFVVLALAAIGWDLPSSFGWENDGIAPRDIFAGVGENLRPGAAFRYPLLHPLLLGLLSLPVLLPAALGARSLHLVDLQPAILAPSVMTACAIIARLVAVAAALVALAALGRIAARLAGRRVGLWSEAFAAVNLSFGYYGRATNLDGPALMWTALAVERLVRAGTRDDGDGNRDDDTARTRDLVGVAICAALSIATKDQAYATYILLVPFALIAGPPVPSGRALARAVGLGALAYGLASGALFNPTGFVTRLRTLGGAASGDYRVYAPGPWGVAANLGDVLGAQSDLWWPWPIVALAWGGVALSIAAVARGARAWRLVPLMAGLGCLVGFTLVVGRAEHRFVLPLGFWLSFYAALALEQARVWARSRLRISTGGLLRVVALLLAGAVVVWSLLAPLSLVLTQWADGRRVVERWLAGRPAGTRVETYGPLVYQPRFQDGSRPGAAYRVTRVGPEPIAGRNPQPGMVEQQGVIADARARGADLLVVTEGFALPYLQEPPRGARVLPAVTIRARGDAATLRFVRAAVADTLPGYDLCFVADSSVPPPFTVKRIHGSTGGRTWVLSRTGGAAPCGKVPE